ncbi:hypothetical protein SOVF_118690 [Spinacia oleracea]|nr:hypothetical protein SOVF_118690 [Spinacia oleracea]
MSYPDQLLWVSDPKKCIPKRVLDFTHTWPALLRFGPLESTYTYLNCSGTKLDPSVLPMGTSVISCMSGSNHTVVAAFDHEAETKMLERGGERKCEVIERVNAAFWWPEMRYGYEYRHGDEYRHGYYPIDDLSNVFVQLGWDIPSCGDCILRGGSCGLVGDSGIEVACYIPASSSSVSCMSGGNYTVVAAFDSTAEEKMLERGREWKCEMIERVNVAFWGPGMQYEYDYDRHGYYPMDLSNVFVQLGWDIPGCGDCMVRGGSCGLVGDSGLEVACYIPASSSSGLPKSAKYGLILGAGIPGLVCIVGLTFYTSSRVSARRNQTRRYTNTESSPSIFPQPIILTLGLDLPTIESYPKTILGESKRLPKPSDNICPICLSEYQPKEALRSIPECNHYFHADCIDEWLRMNATCPLCRNSPQSSSGVAGSGR